jgi:hypothetical protein
MPTEVRAAQSQLLSPNVQGFAHCGESRLKM